MTLPRQSPPAPHLAYQSWPKDVGAKFAPVRSLGKGNFGQVMLMRKLGTLPHEPNHFCAMKKINASTGTQRQYAHREMYILRELCHTNIVKLVDSWEDPNTNSAFMALSYAKGVTLESILSDLGAPSLFFCRAVIAQLVDAAAYLHSHAVIHRDIKPDNIIVSNVDYQDATLVAGKKPLVNDPTTIDWGKILKKWHITLVDFGFARALTAQDVKPDNKSTSKRRNIGRSGRTNKKSLGGSIDDRMVDTSSSGHRKSSKKQKNPNDGSSHSQDVSISRRIVRQLSAVGSRAYSAPEVKNKVRKNTSMEASRHKTMSSTLSAYVSDYGLNADAFSVGATARYILTGVDPNENVQDVMARHNNPVNRLARGVGRTIGSKNKKKNHPRPQKTFRSAADIPPEAIRMIKAMTHANPKERTSVRVARIYPYIDDALDGRPFRKDMHFLDCALPTHGDEGQYDDWEV